MDKNYIYIRDENGKVIGRTYGPSYLGDQRVAAKEGGGSAPESFRAGQPEKDTKGSLPGIKLIVQWLAEDIRTLFFRYCRDKALSGIAAGVLALALAIGSLLTSGLSLMTLVWALLMLGIGVALFLKKQRASVWLFSLFGALELLQSAVVLFQFFNNGVPLFSLFILGYILRVTLGAAMFFSLAWLAKNRFGKGKKGYLWLLPTALQVVYCATFIPSGIPLFPLLHAVFAYSAASWLVNPYSEE